MRYRESDQLTTMTTTINYELDDLIINQPQVAATKPRRRRNKNKSREAGGGGAHRRKLTEEKVRLLELHFNKEHKVESKKMNLLASELGLDTRQVVVWFQNRRARLKMQKLKEDYSSLKKAHNDAVVEIMKLEYEVQKLKEQLSEAEKIHRLSTERVGGGGLINTRSSPLSMEANIGPPAFGEFGVKEYDVDDVFYMSQNNLINDMEWINMYYMWS